MEELKVGDIVTDGLGLKGRVTRIEYKPTSPYTQSLWPTKPSIQIYVEWFLPGDEE